MDSPLICPACGNKMSPVTIDGVTVDTCKGGCGGLWFDKDELDKFEDASDFAGAELLEVPRDPTIKVDPHSIRKCPRCKDEVLVRGFSDVPNKVEVNQCWNCSGIFLDPGELATLRTEYKTAAERSKAASDYADSVFSGHIKEMNSETKAEIREYNAELSNPLKAFTYAFKKMFSSDD